MVSAKKVGILAVTMLGAVRIAVCSPLFNAVLLVFGYVLCFSYMILIGKGMGIA
jgi:hypothetical protein